MISNCNACQKYRNLNPREPLLSHETPKDVNRGVKITSQVASVD